MARAALNQATFERIGTEAFLEAAAAAGVQEVGLWRHKLPAAGAAAAGALAASAGVRVTSLCRGGFFTGATQAERRRAIADTCAAIEEAAALGCPTLVLVCGPAADGDLPGARAVIARAVEEVVPVAADHGVTLAIEAFHPVFAADRSAIVTLDQACELAERFDSAHVGVAVDTFHLWWDPGLERAIARAAGRIATVQLGDWPAVMGVPLRGRALPGDGVAPLAEVLALVLAAGYDGPVEVEVLSEEVWARPPDAVARLARERTEELLAAARARAAGREPAREGR
jgi:sugar phosphate isomerase/epimerase